MEMFLKGLLLQCNIWEIYEQVAGWSFLCHVYTFPASNNWGTCQNRDTSAQKFSEVYSFEVSTVDDWVNTNSGKTLVFMLN